MLNYSQFFQKYWTAGGENSNSVMGNLNLFGNYCSKNMSWENSLEVGFGLHSFSLDDLGKTNDNFDLNSKLGMKKNRSISYVALLNIRNQFAPGYISYDNIAGSISTHTISSLMSPAYLTLALGVEYRPRKFFSFVLSPLAAKTTVVINQVAKEVNEGVFGVDLGKQFRNDIGWFYRFELKTSVMENIYLNTRLDLYSSYIMNQGNIDVNWDVLLNMKINNFLSANLNASLIYDDDTRTPSYKGTVYYLRGPRIQIKEMLGVGLCLKF